jgi:hypothetical protein
VWEGPGRSGAGAVVSVVGGAGCGLRPQKIRRVLCRQRICKKTIVRSARNRVQIWNAAFMWILHRKCIFGSVFMMHFCAECSIHSRDVGVNERRLREGPPPLRGMLRKTCPKLGTQFPLSKIFIIIETSLPPCQSSDPPKKAGNWAAPARSAPLELSVLPCPFCVPRPEARLECMPRPCCTTPTQRPASAPALPRAFARARLVDDFVGEATRTALLRPVADAALPEARPVHLLWPFGTTPTQRPAPAPARPSATLARSPLRD